MLKETLLAAATRAWHHHPKYPGEEQGLEPVPYLHLPFRKEDLYHWQLRPSQTGIGTKVDYEISDGWYYSKTVKKLIRRIVPAGHGAVDFALPYGFPVAAPCEGFAVSSYYSYPLFDRQRFGIGYFVQIYNPTARRIVQLGHLSNIADTIPFGIPVRKDSSWMPTGHLLTPQQMASGKHSNVVWVNTGDLVGYVGYSGMRGEEDHVDGYNRPRQIEQDKNPTLIPHIHMDDSMRNYVTGAKDWRRDPYDKYMKGPYYATHTNKESMGKEPLFLTDESDRPLFAGS